MLIFSQVRGPHSTGVASVSRGPDHETKMAKALGRPDMLIDYDKRYDRVVDFGKKFILGHNRFATQGKINVKNAHPYNFENIVGCHNGTIPDYRLRELKKGPEDYGTDSECVLANINEYSLEETFRTLSGAWAFVWFDRRYNTLNFLRDPNRYLCYCYSEDRETIFWASEKGFLDAALTRNKIPYTTVYEVSADAHTRWEIPDVGKPFDKARQRKIVSGVWVSNSTRFPVQSGTNDTDNSKDSRTGVVGAPHVSQTAQGSGAKSNVVNLPNHAKKVKEFEVAANLPNFDGQGYMRRKHKDVYRGFQGEQLSKQLFEDRTKDGCLWCEAEAEWGQPVRFTSKDTHICLDCSSDGQVRAVCGIDK